MTGVFLIFDGVTHVLKVTAVVDASRTLGFDPDVMPLIGAIEVLCLLLWLVPRTAVLGAVLLTGYLGGAVAAQLRIDAPVASTTLFPVYVAIFVWIALLRDRRLAALLLRPAGAAT